MGRFKVSLVAELDQGRGSLGSPCQQVSLLKLVWQEGVGCNRNHFTLSQLQAPCKEGKPPRIAPEIRWLQRVRPQRW